MPVNKSVKESWRSMSFQDRASALNVEQHIL
jgi:hypothetical protein